MKFSKPINRATNSVFGRGVDFLRRTKLFDHPAVRDRDFIRDREAFLLIVRDKHRRDASFSAAA